MSSGNSGLHHSVRTARRAGLSRDLPYGPADLQWVANSATLIYGERDAVLVDTYISVDQNAELVEWVKSFDRKLTHVYITHGHGDHFFGIKQLLEAFPQARAVGTAQTAAACYPHSQPPLLNGFYERLFPGQIPTPVVCPEALQEGFITIEGHRLEVVRTGFTDTTDTTVLWVPDLRLVVAGDVVYNDTHQYMVETTAASREQWAQATEKVAALNPVTVVAGHKKPHTPDASGSLAETAAYLRDFNEAITKSATPEDLYGTMLKLYPDRANPGALWRSAKAALARTS